jgi:Nuclease subunit of the excinuclease complex
MEEQAFNDSLIEIPYSKENIKNLANNLPEDPGVYKFLDQEMQPIYIGKAKNLKNRVISYFRDSEKKSKKVKKLVKYSKKIEITLTESELEALLIEQHLIKQTKPRFNVQN